MIRRLWQILRPSSRDEGRPQVSEVAELSRRDGAIAGLKIDAVWPARSAGDSALNKDGQLVLAARMDGRPVKIYEARDARHAIFIQAVSRHPAVGSLFPRIFAIDGPVVVAEWIEGTPATPDIDRLVDLQHRLHAAPLAGLPDVGFDYWHDYVEPRFVRALRLLGRHAMADRVVPQVTELWNAEPGTLMNPDVIPGNLFVDGSGCLKIVDNGDLTRGGLPWLDILNTANALAPGDRTAYVKRYLGLRPSSAPGRDLRALNAAWLARTVGAHCVAGRMKSADDMLDAFSRGQSVLPVDLSEDQL